jgi:hypothetical protein
MKQLALGLCILSLLVADAAEARTIKVAVIIGNNRGHHTSSRRALRYAQQDATKVYKVLRAVGELEDENAILLNGKTAAEARAALSKVERRVTGLRRRHPGARIVLIVYYSGHADGSVLEMGTTALDYDWLVKYFERSKAHVRLAFIDACLSGAILKSKSGRHVRGARRQISIKGGRRGRGYPLMRSTINGEEMTWRGYAVITSSAADEMSMESQEIMGSFFTHYLVSGLWGAADQAGNRDGRNTLEEVYDFAYRRTVGKTSTMTGVSQHPTKHVRLSGSGRIVLTAKKKPFLTVKSARDRRLVVVNHIATEAVAETSVRAGQPTRLALAPGRYKVYLLDEQNRGTHYAHYAPLVLSKGSNERLNDRNFVRTRLKRSVDKGGLFTGAGVSQREPEPERSARAERAAAGRGASAHGVEAVVRRPPPARERYQISGSFLLRRGPLEGTGPAMGMALELERALASWVSAVVRGDWTRAPDAGLSTGYNDFGVHVGLRFPLLQWIVKPHLGFLVGYEHIFQDTIEENGQSVYRNSAGLNYLATADLEIEVHRLVSLQVSGAVGGRLFRVRTTPTSYDHVSQLDWQLLAGLGVHL